MRQFCRLLTCFKDTLVKLKHVLSRRLLGYSAFLDSPLLTLMYKADHLKKMPVEASDFTGRFPNLDFPQNYRRTRFD